MTSSLLIKETLPSSAPFYKVKAPFTHAILKHKEKINTNQTQTNSYHLLIDISGSNIQFLEGQSLGVLPPGCTTAGKPHKLRLYSIASSRHGESFQKNSHLIGFTVKRVLEMDQQQKHIIYKGVASNYLLNMEIGSRFDITGPVGKTFVLPRNPQCDLLFIATGTGIAPFRGFLQYLCLHHPNWRGNICIFFGARYSHELLYCNNVNHEILDYIKKLKQKSNSGQQIHLFTACSREQMNSKNQRLYVSDLLIKHRKVVYDLLTSKNGVAVYICGLVGLRKSIPQTLQSIFHDFSANWDAVMQDLKANGRWNIDVY